jgi:hypothetical protein
MKYAVGLASDGMVYIPCFMNRFRHSSNVKVMTSTNSEAAVLIFADGRGL